MNEPLKRCHFPDAHVPALSVHHDPIRHLFPATLIPFVLRDDVMAGDALQAAQSSSKRTEAQISPLPQAR